MIVEKDLASSIQHSIVQAKNNKAALQIICGGSKSFYGRQPVGTPLSIAGHQGVINYYPSELVITARTGTLLSDIEHLLAEHGQMLAFDPPYFSSQASLGGAIACGFSGSRRPYYGSARDFVLGCKLIDGQGRVLSFGGEVMKNVAGYDVSRLVVGALGTLGVLLEVSLKVLPKPATEQSRVFELSSEQALPRMKQIAQQSLPLSAISYDGHLLAVRLSGAEQAVQQAAKSLGGDTIEDDKRYWESCNEHQHPFFSNADELWRISLPPSTDELDVSGDWFYDWGGAQRWLKSSETPQRIFDLAAQAEGHAGLFRSRDRQQQWFQPLPPAMKALHARIKASFDPDNILNPYRIYKDW